MNRTELIHVVSQKTKLTQKLTEEVITAYLDAITEALSKGEKVVITGFGTFEVRNRVERTGKNPRTGEQIVIPAQKAPAFKPGKGLKDSLK